MPRSIHRLDRRILKTKKPGKYPDGGGLHLIVKKEGTRKWVLRYTYNGKVRDMGLGRLADATIEEAREQARIARNLVKEGIDPIEDRQQKKAKNIQANQSRTKQRAKTFRHYADEYIKSHEKGWCGSHAQEWCSTLERYVHPRIGHKTIEAVTIQAVREILEPIWYTKTTTASRVQNRIETVIDYAYIHLGIQTINPARWSGHLDMVFMPPTRVRPVKHHPAMPYDQTGNFLKRLANSENSSAPALRFLILTATRTSEVLNAQWSEIDEDTQTWTIPAERMKNRRPHRVPLSQAAWDLLASLPRNNRPTIFQNPKTGRPYCASELRRLMARLMPQNPYTPHGFRSSFRDWAGEVVTFPHDVVEMALAHTLKDKTVAAYQRGDLLEKRRELMQAWADFLIPSGRLPSLVHEPASQRRRTLNEARE